MAFRRSLRQKLAYTFLGGALLTVLLFSVVIKRIMSDYFARQSQTRLQFLQDQAGKEADADFSVFKEKLQQFFNMEVAALDPISQSGLIGDRLPKTADEREHIAAILRAIENQSQLSMLTIVGLDGRVIIRATNPESFGDDTFVREYENPRGPVSSIHGLVESALAGNHITSYESFAPEILVKENKFEGDRIVSTLADDVRILIKPNPTFNILPGEFEERALMMTVAEPVLNSKKVIVGAIIAGRSLNKDTDFIGEAQTVLRDQATIWLYGPATNIRIAATGGQNGTGSVTQGTAGAQRGATTRKQEVDGELVIRASGGANGQGLLHDHDNTVIGRIALGRPVSLMDSIVHAQEDIEGSVERKTTYSIIGLAIISMIIATVIAWIFSKRITRRIDQLRGGADIIASGSLEHRLAIDSGDEIELLASQFNSMAAKLQESHHTLEGKVEERTRELKESQEAMVQQEKIAGIGQLAAGIAHEMNTPLGTIIGYAQMLREDLAAQTTANGALHDVDEIIEQAGRCRDLVMNLLNFSRRSTTEKSEADLNVIIRKILSLVEHDFELKRIHVEFALSPNLPKARVNENEIAQVILNLANNAADSMPVGGELRVSTAYEEAEDRIRIEVHDSGCGIKDSDRMRVFEPFFTTKEVGRGTGLGLSICYKIIENHMGSMGFDSSIGEGTTFRVYLPVNAEVRVA